MQGPIDENRLKQIFRQPMNIPFPRKPCIAPDGSFCNPLLLTRDAVVVVQRDSWAEHLIRCIDKAQPLSLIDRLCLSLENNTPRTGRISFIVGFLAEAVAVKRSYVVECPDRGRNGENE